MKQNAILTTTSLLTILFATFHLADDIVRGFSPGGVSNLIATAFVVVWLYGTVMLADRRSGYIIMLLGSLLSSGIPVLHMRGAGLAGGRIANSSGMFFFVWTNLALSATAMFSIVLSARALWISAHTDNS